MIKKQWMRYALLAEIERRLGHRERAIQYAQEAVNASNDVERYMLVKSRKDITPHLNLSYIRHRITMNEDRIHLNHTLWLVEKRFGLKTKRSLHRLNYVRLN
ncbi:hypothetical protein ACMX2M_09405 [Paenibacillus polymyxa]|uniref:hypothetical protein n=1 Tax=Paenibacillus amylolyticus TaxID=1451 RepID=UPI003242140B